MKKKCNGDSRIDFDIKTPQPTIVYLFLNFVRLSKVD